MFCGCRKAIVGVRKPNDDRKQSLHELNEEVVLEPHLETSVDLNWSSEFERSQRYPLAGALTQRPLRVVRAMSPRKWTAVVSCIKM